MGDLISVGLPASKSISNRILILKLLYNIPIDIQNLSESDDTHIFQKIIEHFVDDIWDVKNCGAALRFFLSVAFILEKEVVITGDERLKERPIKPLVDALNQLGAHIQYLEKEGFAPLKISSKHSNNLLNHLMIDGTLSSQFVSSIIMIACKIQPSLDIQLLGKITSLPYIQMTVQLMKNFDLPIEFEHDKIHTTFQTQAQFNKNSYIIESDWSSASYIYLWCLFLKNKKLHLKGLYKDSLQGDSIVQSYFELFGVYTNWLNDDEVILEYQEIHSKNIIEIDCTSCPDLAMTFAIAAFGENRELILRGLSNLNLKESPRFDMIQLYLNELSLDAVEIIDSDSLRICRKGEIRSGYMVETHNDHRIALAFAPLSVYAPIEFDKPEVVSKSFPSYWQEVSKLF